MKKCKVVVGFVGMLALLLSGCRSKATNTIEEISTEISQIEISQIEMSQIEMSQIEESLIEKYSLEKPAKSKLQTKETLSFLDFKNLEFLFSSGAGGWGTTLTIKEDGSFAGEYHDGEMGVRSDAYPNGTRYQCSFSGQLAEPEKINEYTYSMQIKEINYAQEAGTQEIIDGVLYIYDKPYGLENTDELLVYMQGSPLAELPDEFRSWVGYYDLAYTEETQLPFYALYNEPEQCGFSSYDVVEQLMEMVSIYEDMAERTNDYLMHEAMTQLDMNMKSGELYEIWDNLLNDVWSVLQQTLDEEEMAALVVEEREWIAMKEAEIEAVGAEYEGGSIASLMVNMKAANLTEDRVYELLEYLK